MPQASCITTFACYPAPLVPLGGTHEAVKVRSGRFIETQNCKPTYTVGVIEGERKLVGPSALLKRSMSVPGSFVVAPNGLVVELRGVAREEHAGMLLNAMDSAAADSGSIRIVPWRVLGLRKNGVVVGVYEAADAPS